MRRGLSLFVVAVALLVATTAAFQGPGVTSDALKAVEMRSLGPAYTTGRVQDITVDPNNSSIYYVASAAGGLWKSTNRGQTFAPIFDSGGAFNLCCIVVDPKNSNTLWLGTGENSVPRSAMIGDGLYKSTDAGATWARIALPNSEHIGNIRIDPRNSNVVYVAAQGPLWSSGGDRGVYKTTDGGQTWKAVLTVSQYTGAAEVVLDPNNPDVVYASMWQRQRTVGNMIGGGPESGFYKSTDGGGKWTKITKGLPAGDVGRMSLGVDPKAKPTRVYALLNGLQGESGFYRSDDAGASFARMGAPFGKPGTENEPVQPCDTAAGRRGGGGGPVDVLAPTPPARGGAAAATPPAGRGAGRGGQAAPPAGGAAGAGAAGAGAAGVAQAGRGGGGGGRGNCATGAYCGGDPGYYQEIYVDPVRPDTIWSMNTNLEWSRDGGRCWSGVPTMGGVHVDFHAVWSDTKDTNHIIVGSDGGAFESYDNGGTWKQFENLPITQFYRVAVDNKAPFYYVCGGAQDNGSMCGPSRTMASVGIRTSEWFTSGGGDGFFNLIDPEDPNYQYSSSQDGAIQRLDLRTGQSRGIRPPQSQGSGGGRGGGGGGAGAGAGGTPADRTNWDTPYIISPHSSTRLYWGSQYLYRTDDRGDSWSRISPDLTRNLDYREIQIMGKMWDQNNSVAYHNATTTLSDITAIDESPLLEDLIYVGTDDGNVQTTEDGGKTWRKTAQFSGPGYDGAWVTSVFASPRDPNVVFITQNDWQHGVYKPIVWRSDDKGKTFKSIVGDLPDRYPCWSIVQDHINPNLLFLGTEWGLFVTVDGGMHWSKITRGLPAAVQVRDITIQKRENDLVIGTFGRGFYVLDDYSAFREITAASLAREAELYPLRNTYRFDQIGQYSGQDGNWRTPNPTFGAVFAYSVGANFTGNLVLNIADSSGRTVCRMDVPERDANGALVVGVSRAAWDLRVGGGGGGGRGGGGGGGGGRGGGGNNITVPCLPVSSGAGSAGASAGDPNALAQQAQAQQGGGRGGGGSPMAELGRYTATLAKLAPEGGITMIGKPQSFSLIPLLPRNWNNPF